MSLTSWQCVVSSCSTVVCIVVKQNITEGVRGYITLNDIEANSGENCFKIKIGIQNN